MTRKESKQWLKELKEEQRNREKEIEQYNNTDLWTLKNLGKSLKGMSFTGKLGRIGRNIKWAWQRAWRGYDDLAVVNYDLWFPDITMQILKDLYVVNEGGWCKPKEEIENGSKLSLEYWYSLEETQNKIKNMIMLLNMINDVDNPDKNIQQAQEEFLIQFSRHWNNLWW